MVLDDVADDARFVVETPAAGDAETCVRTAVEPAIKALKLQESINSKVAITIK